MFSHDFLNRAGENTLKKLWLGLAIALSISLLASAARQIYLQKRNTQRINQKKEELALLERKNQELKAKLQDAQSPEYLENQVKKMLGLPEQESSSEAGETYDLQVKEEIFTPKFKQWWKLFVY